MSFRKLRVWWKRQTSRELQYSVVRTVIEGSTRTVKFRKALSALQRQGGLQRMQA